MMQFEPQNILSQHKATNLKYFFSKRILQDYKITCFPILRFRFKFPDSNDMAFSSENAEKVSESSN